jgi:hypothetical protein
MVSEPVPLFCDRSHTGKRFAITICFLIYFVTRFRPQILASYFTNLVSVVFVYVVGVSFLSSIARFAVF